MVSRIAKGWIVRIGGRVVAGPFYSLDYAERRDKEMAAKVRRTQRQNRLASR